jgi:hypothetical protein
MNMKKIFVTIFLLLSTAGCIGNLTSVHRNLEVSKGKGALIDIKQRGILSSVVPVYDKDGKVLRNETRVCAEASPDALSAYAAELAAKVDTGKVGAELAAALQEASSFVGMRTPTIQALRDASYRLCESYLNNAISGAEYGWQLRRFQRNMVVLAAVEQLTGSTRVPPITIKMQGQAEVSKSLSEITTQKQKIDAEISKLESGTPEEKEKNKAQLAELKQNSNTLNDAMLNARSLVAAGSGTTAVDSVNVAQSSAQNIAAVSADVKEMVNQILAQDDRGQLCFMYLDAYYKNEDKINEQLNNQFAEICKTFLETPNVVLKFLLQSSDSPTHASAPVNIPDVRKNAANIPDVRKNQNVKKEVKK